MSTVLVLGGAGFIGCNLCKRLLKDANNYVVCIDNFYTGRKINVSDILDNNFELIISDIIDNNFVDIISNKFSKIDQIYNLACPASPPKYQKDPVYTTKISVIGNINALELAVLKSSKYLFTSTSEVYGEPTEHPQRESYRGNVNTVGIRSCYDEGKRCAESIVSDYRRSKDVDTKIVRIFNTYGPYMDPLDGRVISNFINQSIKNEPITIYGDGTQTRSLCYVDDIVEGLIRMMNTNKSVGGPINLGNPSELTIKNLAEIIKTITNSSSDIVYKELPSDDPTRRKPDISLSNRILSWSPNTNLYEGLRKTINYYRNLL